MRTIIVPVLLSVGLVAPTARGQFGDRGGFGRGGDPSEMIWNMMSRGQGDTIDLNQRPDIRERILSRGGTLPPNGILTKDAFVADMRQRMASGSFGRGSSFGGSPPGSPPSSSFGPPGGSSSGNRFDPANYLRDKDRNGDGKISIDEASNRMRDSFAQYDVNRDGGVDINEVQAYVSSFSSGRSFGGGPPSFSPSSSGPPGSSSSPGSPPSFQPPYSPSPPSGYGGPPPGSDGRDGRRDEPRDGTPNDEARPTVYRFGHLPKEVPSWFTELDGDSDGQVGLYEWRKAERATKEFVEMDLNGDCYLTAAEWIRYNQLLQERKPTTTTDGDGSSRSGSSAFSGRGGPPSFSFSRDRESRDGRRDRDRDRGGPPSGGSPPSNPPSGR